MSEYSLKEYLKDDWQFLVRFYLAFSWGFMPAVTGLLIIEDHIWIGTSLFLAGMVWLLFIISVTRPRCFP